MDTKEVIDVNGVDPKSQSFSNNDWKWEIQEASDIVSEAMEAIAPVAEVVETPVVIENAEEVVIVDPTTVGEEVVATEEVKEEVTKTEEVDLNLTPAEEKVVEKIEEKKDEWKKLSDIEIIIDRTLTDLKESRQQLQEVEIENKVLKEALERQKMEVATMKANPNYMEVPDDLMQVIDRYKSYSTDRSDENSYDKLIRSIYWTLDKLGWPSIEDALEWHMSFKKRQVMAIGWSVTKVNESNVPELKPAEKTPTVFWVPWKASFTNR